MPQPSALEPARAADRDSLPLDHALDSLPGPLLHPLGEAELETASLGPVDERLGERVPRELVERGGEAQDFLPGHTVQRDDLLDVGRAERQRARLVQERGADACRAARSRRRP